MSTHESSLFFEKGWCQFQFDPALANWVDQALAAARRSVTDPANEQWHRHGGTWFVGVNTLDNNQRGSVDNGPPLSGHAVNFVLENLNQGEIQWDRAQVSVCYPGYPARSGSESEAAFLYRQNRDAAHIDGLRRQGPYQRRFLREFHGFILGIPIVDFSADASPFVIWEGSHEIIRNAFIDFFQGITPEKWKDCDLTDYYRELRRQIFRQCNRIEISVKPGHAYLVHRMALHGIAPWSGAAKATRDGRMICYFRPETGGPKEWLYNP